MSAQSMAHYTVTFTLEYATVTTVAIVPYRDDDDPASSDDPAAINVAIELLQGEYGFDVSDYIDVSVELDGVTR